MDTSCVKEFFMRISDFLSKSFLLSKTTWALVAVAGTGVAIACLEGGEAGTCAAEPASEDMRRARGGEARTCAAEALWRQEARTCAALGGRPGHLQ